MASLLTGGRTMATIYDVARLAGVSIATVSRVINRSGKVAAATRQKVIEAAQALNWQPNAIAQALARA